MTEGRSMDFAAVYRGIPPWEIGAPQPALAGIVAAAAGALLDIGCGTGELALLAASHGLDAAGIDAAPNAIEIARQRAADRRLDVDFRVGDALDLPSEWADRFDLVADSGMFHVFGDAERIVYARNLATVVRPGGEYAMLAFSDREPGDWGPRRVGEAEVRDTFADGWTVKSIERATFVLNPQASTAREAAQALRAQLIRDPS